MTNDPVIPEALSAAREFLSGRAGQVSYYFHSTSPTTQAHESPPLLLIHSVNAAGSAYEVKPLFEHFVRQGRTVYAMDLPGFGFSDRSPRVYSPRLMTEAILDVMQLIAKRHNALPIDALAVSLASEFLARAATLQASMFRTVALVSPTGFDRRAPYYGDAESDRGMAWLYRFFNFALWRRGIFDLLTTHSSIRFFLRKTWGSNHIDEGLARYDYLTARHPEAHHAVYRFVSGYLFSADITRVYETLAMPVWMSHGVRGDFTDYRYKSALSHVQNWHFDVFDTGALPYFEQPGIFADRYEAFLSKHG